MSLIKIVSPENAEGEVAEAYSSFEKAKLAIPKSFMILSTSPGLVKIKRQISDYYRNHPTLGFPLLSVIRYLVAKKFSYVSCRDFNRDLLKMQGMDETEINNLESYPEQAPLEDRDRAMLAFVLKAIESPESVKQEDVKVLRDLGWMDGDIVDAVYHGANMIGAGIIEKAFKI